MLKPFEEHAVFRSCFVKTIPIIIWRLTCSLLCERSQNDSVSVQKVYFLLWTELCIHSLEAVSAEASWTILRTLQVLWMLSSHSYVFKYMQFVDLSGFMISVRPKAMRDQIQFMIAIPLSIRNLAHHIAEYVSFFMPNCISEAHKPVKYSVCTHCAIAFSAYEWEFVFSGQSLIQWIVLGSVSGKISFKFFCLCRLIVTVMSLRMGARTSE